MRNDFKFHEKLLLAMASLTKKNLLLISIKYLLNPTPQITNTQTYTAISLLGKLTHNTYTKPFKHDIDIDLNYTF